MTDILGNSSEGGQSNDFIGDVTMDSNLDVAGNLTVVGTTTTTDTAIHIVNDPLMHLGKNNPADTADAGFFVEYQDGGTKYTGLIRDADQDAYYLIDNKTIEPSNATTYGNNLANFTNKNTLSSKFTSYVTPADDVFSYSASVSELGNKYCLYCPNPGDNYGLGVTGNRFELFTIGDSDNFTFSFGGNSGDLTDTFIINQTIRGAICQEVRAATSSGLKLSEDSGIVGILVKDLGDVDISISGKLTTVKGTLQVDEDIKALAGSSITLKNSDATGFLTIAVDGSMQIGGASNELSFTSKLLRLDDTKYTINGSIGQLEYLKGKGMTNASDTKYLTSTTDVLYHLVGDDTPTKGFHWVGATGLTRNSLMELTNDGRAHIATSLNTPLMTSTAIKAIDSVGLQLQSKTGLNGFKVLDLGICEIGTTGRDTAIKGTFTMDETARALVSLETPLLKGNGSDLSIDAVGNNSIVLKANSVQAATIAPTGDITIDNNLDCLEFNNTTNNTLIFDTVYSATATTINFTDGRKTTNGISSPLVRWSRSVQTFTRATPFTCDILINSFSGNFTQIGIGITGMANNQVDALGMVFYNISGGDAGDYLDGSSAAPRYKGVVGASLAATDVLRLVNDGLGNLEFWKQTGGAGSFILQYTMAAYYDSGATALHVYVGDPNTNTSTFSCSIVHDEPIISGTLRTNVIKTNAIQSVDSNGLRIASNAGALPLKILSSTGTIPSSNCLVLENQNNVAGQNCMQLIRVAGGVGGDPMITFDIFNTASFAMGLDNSDSDKFKMGLNWSDVGTNTLFELDRLGTTTLTSTTGAFIPNLLTTTQRDALTPTEGMTCFNTTNDGLEYYDSAYSTWRGSNQAKAYGDFYVSTPAVTTIATTNVWVKAAGTVTATHSLNYTVGSNRLTYTGGDTRLFNVQLSGSVSPGTTTAQVLALGISLNGGANPLLSTICKDDSNSTAKYAAMSSNSIIQMSTNDYVEIWIRNETNINNPTVQTGHLTLVEL